MARYRIEESIVDTEKASRTIKLASQKAQYGFDRPKLHRSRKGRWYLEHDFNWALDHGSPDYAEWISPEEAVRLILADGQDVPDDCPELAKVVDNVVE